jgi:hypothetical protein
MGSGYSFGDAVRGKLEKNMGEFFDTHEWCGKLDHFTLEYECEPNYDYA